MISLGTKAGKISRGEFQCENSIKDGKAMLAIVALDASDNTKKHFTDMCAYRKIPVYSYGTREDLGRALGKDLISVVTINDKGFENGIRKLLAEV